MYNSRKEKDIQLKMPYGTAMARLRKSILFQLVQETGRDICFKCGNRIDSIEELSIEHKEPWFGRDTDLFWDLNNISFSHLRCNIPHTYEKISLRNVGPEGTSWCYLCKEFQPITEFHKDNTRWNGLDNRCRKHRAGENHWRKKYA